MNPIKSTFDPQGVQEWVKWWYANREAQKKANEKALNGPGIFPWQRFSFDNQLKLLSSTQYSTNPLADLPEELKKELLKSKHDLDDRRVNGMTLLPRNNPQLKGPFIYYNNRTLPGASIQVHETAHAQDPQIQALLISAFKPKLQNGQRADEYLDDPEEINSRVMEFRYVNQLDPKKIYTIEEIKKMKNSGDGGSSWSDSRRPLNLLDRYDDKTLLFLINDLAKEETPQKYEVSYAHKGKKISYLTLFK